MCLVVTNLLLLTYSALVVEVKTSQLPTAYFQNGCRNSPALLVYCLLVILVSLVNTFSFRPELS